MNTDGSFTCDCKSGYKKEMELCIDIDECATEIPPCHVLADCTNTDGSFTCVCQSGFVGDGHLCIIEPGMSAE